MKLPKRNLLYSWRFYSLGEAPYRKCMEKVFTNNLISLRQINVIVAVLVVCFSIFPLAVERNLSKMLVYQIAFVIAVLIAIIAHHKHKQAKPVSHRFLYTAIVIYFVNIIWFGIYLGVWANPDELAGIFIAVLIIALFLFTIPPMFSLCLNTIAVILFVVSDVLVKDTIHLIFDTVNILLAYCVSLIFGWITTKYRLSAVLTASKLEAELSDAEERAGLMLDAGPLCCQLWDRNLNLIDCNEAGVHLYGFKDKQEYMERWIKECSPEYQPDGQLSSKKAVLLVTKAFEEGRCVVDWMHRMTDGTPLPTEITLVRVKYKDDFIVAGYTRDLRTEKKLEDKVYYDALTGIYNRRYLDENLDRLIKTLSRSEGYLSLMMIDIDRYKQYNDTYGHDVGDACLRTVAEILSKSITRTEDFVVRYGGEEFAIVLPNTDEAGACRIAGILLENVRNSNIPHESSDIADHVTLSIGVTTGKADYTQNPGDYIKRADEMLYASKQSGRDRYSFVAV